ncbi:MAG TPA: hypothetical protein PK400_10605 [Phycisphaerales bacterium]|nr:hypothetical protein [Phycisphaerales bacterium]HRQ75397.1 hypothetical protein [Phycisphaerales bacterium]
MPEPPASSLIARYILENPYPLGGILIVLALGLAWMGLREGRKKPLQIAAISGAAAMAVLLIGFIVVTPAEHGERITREFVEHAVAGNVAGASGLLHPDAALSFGSPRNPGVSIDVIRSALERLRRDIDISSNRITTLRGYTEDADHATVHLACWTTAEGRYGGGPTPSQWVLRVARDENGDWFIMRITAVSIAGQRPSDRLPW